MIRNLFEGDAVQCAVEPLLSAIPLTACNISPKLSNSSSVHTSKGLAEPMSSCFGTIDAMTFR